MIGRFSTTAQLHLLDEERVNNQSLFKWYTFKLGDKPTGELLAVFELIQVDPVYFLTKIHHKTYFEIFIYFYNRRQEDFKRHASSKKFQYQQLTIHRQTLLPN